MVWCICLCHTALSEGLEHWKWNQVTVAGSNMSMSVTAASLQYLLYCPYACFVGLIVHLANHRLDDPVIPCLVL